MPKDEVDMCLPKNIKKDLKTYLTIHGGDKHFLEYEIWYAINFSEDRGASILKDLSDKKVYMDWEIMKEERSKLERMCASRLQKPPHLVKGVFTCKKCKGDEFITDEKQTRSSDEGQTLFCQCVDCGQRIKFN